MTGSLGFKYSHQTHFTIKTWQEGDLEHVTCVFNYQGILQHIASSELDRRNRRHSVTLHSHRTLVWLAIDFDL